jgi:hypothetical protein
MGLLENHESELGGMTTELSNFMENRKGFSDLCRVLSNALYRAILIGNDLSPCRGLG